MPLARIAPPISGQLIIITVKPGDSLWKFAAERLGNGCRWQELLSLNSSLRNPNIIRTGTQIFVPASIASQRTAIKYTVRHGDSLWSIAQAHFGHATSWPCIAHANPDLRARNLIHEGQGLLLPASCPSL